MASGSDTLNIESLRMVGDYPIAQVQAETPAVPADDPVNHPTAAAIARARIAALDNPMPLPSVSNIPATPTADLVTNRTVLAEQATTAPVIGRRPIPSALQPLLAAAGVFLLTLLLFKAPIVLSQLGYTFSGHQNTPAAASAVTAATINVPAADTITIPKINVHAPVVYEQSVAEGDIETALESGVVHYGNTAVPGQAGNVAIFGHSSNDWWQPGNYKFVFVLLDKLSPGDDVYVDYNSHRYTYQVTSSKVVDPTDVAVLDTTPTPTLSLITCTPPGTSLRRLVVTAVQISPNPSAATAATPAATPASGTTLPSSAPGFLTELDQAWDGVANGFKSLFGAGTDNSTSPSASPSSGTGVLPAAN